MRYALLLATLAAALVVSPAYAGNGNGQDKKAPSSPAESQTILVSGPTRIDPSSIPSGASDAPMGSDLVRRLHRHVLERHCALGAERLERARVHLPAPHVVRQRGRHHLRERLAELRPERLVHALELLRPVVERRLRRLLHAESERLHPLVLALGADQRCPLGQQPSRLDGLGLRRGDVRKTALQVAAGIVIAVSVLFVIAFVVNLVWSH